MYKIALIQNQSEAFELSYGDVFSWFERAFPHYEWDLYSTEKSLPALFERIETLYYDALVFTTNTFNDIYLEHAWSDKAGLIEHFCEAQKGVLVFQQIKLVDRHLPMMPEPLTVEVRARPAADLDDPLPPSMRIADDHPLLHYPSDVDVDQILQACRESHSIEYVYWTVLAPVHPERWHEVFVDDSYSAGRRPLLLASGPQTKGRVVVTAMVLDWQRQLQPLRNLLTYVVEGIHGTAVVRRRAKSSYDFEYLLENLRIAKHAFREYELERLDFTALHRGIHDVVILDPAWSPAEITAERLETFRACMKPESKLIYFDVESLGEPAITAVGGLAPFAERHHEALMYVKNAFDLATGRWDGSYFSTVHVLESLQSIGEPIHEYKAPFMSSIEPHDQDGSYDEQFATTCALLKVYYWYLGSGAERFQRTLAWLRREMDTKRARNAGDFARAYLALKECGVSVPTETVRQFATTIAPASTISDDEIVRYIGLFLAYDLVDEAVPWISRLLAVQRPDGSWGSEERNRLFLTALAEDLLLAARSHVSGGPVVADLDEAILNGAIHLKSVDLVAVGPRDRAATIAAVLVAVCRFEERITFPIDGFLKEQRIIADEFRTSRTFEVAAALIEKLQDAKVDLAAELGNARKQLATSRTVANRIGYVSLAFVAALVLCIYLLVGAAHTYGVGKTLQPLGDLDPAAATFLLGLCVVIVGVMARGRVIPHPVRRAARGVIRFVSAPASALEENAEERRRRDHELEGEDR